MRRLIAIALPGGPDLVDELQRVWDEGDAVLPIDLRLAPPARARLLESLRPARLIGPDHAAAELGGSQPVEEGDALVMATSGTTGEPKGVVLTHDAVAASAHATSLRLGVDADRDAWWACLPLSHIGGLSVVTRSLLGDVRCEVVAGFSEEGAARALSRGATLTSLVPTALRRLEPDVIAGFRWVVLGGQAPPAVLPPNVVATYGMTETGSGLVYGGYAIEGAAVRLVGGEVHVRGPMLLRCYRDGRDPKDAEGWFATGDAGTLLQDGRLVVHGRLGDMIISGGENIWPAAVEAAMAGHPALSDVAVAGVADREWGERVVAYVVLADSDRALGDPGPGRLAAAGSALGDPAGGDRALARGAPGRLLAELRELVAAEIASYAAPREVVIVDAIPRTALGKVQRDRLASLGGETVGG
ncbi:MAG: class I adenylate-forming enzyme family protein [Acidimicrobiales bacterium]